jgi:hypothetical protein
MQMLSRDLLRCIENLRYTRVAGMVSRSCSCNMKVQHLIEKFICYNMNKQEYVQTLEKHANI